MIRSLHRQYISWRCITFLGTIAALTMMGFLTGQRNQCILMLASDSLTEVITADDKENVQSSWFDNTTVLENINTTISRYLLFSSELLTQNVSKIGQEWFEIIPEDDYLQNNTDVFTKSRDMKNMLNDTFVIKGDKICKGTAPALLVLIPSVASNVDQRNAIRWTWIRAAETNSWPGAFIRDKIKHVFLFGNTIYGKNESYQQLLEESKIFGDIVMVDFVDTYRNLTRKILTGLKWVRQYCENVQFVLKTDQDTFINIPLMLEVIRHVAARVKNDTFVMGLKHGYFKPSVVREGRWAVSKEEYPLDFYPRYLYGHTYVLSRRAMLSLTDIAHYVTLIPPEDAFITGILPKVTGIIRISAPSFTVCCRHIFDCEIVWNQRVALPEVKSSALLAQLWANVITHSCNDTARFI